MSKSIFYQTLFIIWIVFATLVTWSDTGFVFAPDKLKESSVVKTFFEWRQEFLSARYQPNE